MNKSYIFIIVGLCIIEHSCYNSDVLYNTSLKKQARLIHVELKKTEIILENLKRQQNLIDMIYLKHRLASWRRYVSIHNRPQKLSIRILQNHATSYKDEISCFHEWLNQEVLNRCEDAINGKISFVS